MTTNPPHIDAGPSVRMPPTENMLRSTIAPPLSHQSLLSCLQSDSRPPQSQARAATVVGAAAAPQAARRTLPVSSSRTPTGWGQWGSWGKPGQQVGILRPGDQLRRRLQLVELHGQPVRPHWVPPFRFRRDSRACAGASGYLWVYATSPGTAADGDYPLTATVVRRRGVSVGTRRQAPPSATTRCTRPTASLRRSSGRIPATGRQSPAAPTTWLSHRATTMRSRRSISTSTMCTSLRCSATTPPYTCQLNYSWSLGGATGQHTATFKSYDWMDNVGVLDGQLHRRLT